MNQSGTHDGLTLYIVDKHNWNLVEPNQNIGEII
jgi:hypothetical protein